MRNSDEAYFKTGYAIRIKAYTSDAPTHFEILAKAILNQKSIKADLAK